jgi:hypothetical protein
MRSLSFKISQPVPARVIQEYNRRIEPNLYFVGHLKLMLIDTDLGLCMPGSEEIYDKEAYKLLANVSRRILGKSAYRKRAKHRKRIRNFVTLESMGDTPHLNILIHIPKGVSFEAFEAVFREEWNKLHWTVKSTNALYCRRRNGDCVSYSFKEGDEALLTRSLSFHS